MESQQNRSKVIAIGCIVVALILILGTVWLALGAKRSTEDAASQVSLLYLDELAERREQVVANNIQTNIDTINIAVGLLTEDDLSDMEHLQAFQAQMKQLFKLDKFAFVDANGLIYTSLGTQDDIDQYAFDHMALTAPEVSIKDVESASKKVVIAVPIDDIAFNGQTLKVCFMEISMDRMLAGVSMESSKDATTFCNIYTNDGIPLSNLVLGGAAKEGRLFEAMQHTEFEDGYSLEQMQSDFANGESGTSSFTYNDVRDTLAYVPVEGTDWMLTYLVRDQLISDRIASVSNGVIARAAILAVIAALVLAAVFIYVIRRDKKHAEELLEKETAEAASRAKAEELEQRLALQEELAEKNQALSEALAAAEDANKAKTVFLSNMSHEIRTPMNAIIGLDNIALNDPETPERIKGYLSQIGDSAYHLLDIINDILDMSRIESGRMTLKNEEFNFPKLIESINAMFSAQCHDKGLAYSCRIEGEVDNAYIGDGVKLRQTLINILGNAVKFTDEGSVSLVARKLGEFDDKSTLEFKIADTGQGISADYLPRIFDSFSQEDSSASNKFGSTGLGLAITKNIVEMMGGDIKVESEKGEGSTFTVTVTLMNADDAEDDDAAVEVDPSKMTVLVVDDDPVACDHGKIVLEKAGIAADVAASGAEAVEMVRLRHARQTPYNLILVDWKMPEMDGVETTRRIREIVGDASAIIILTAYHWDDILEEALEAGVDSFISKPLFASTVLEEFKSALQKKRAGTTDEVDLTGRRILVAEDVELNAEILVMLLDVHGIQAEVASNGRIAVEMFSEHEPGYYDAILMDMRMPEMDGLEATQRIRALPREDAASIPIIALTANAFDEDVQRSLQAGLNAHLSKPVGPKVLYDVLGRFIV